jgi:hypothetical protein
MRPRENRRNFQLGGSLAELHLGWSAVVPGPGLLRRAKTDLRQYVGTEPEGPVAAHAKTFSESGQTFAALNHRVDDALTQIHAERFHQSTSVSGIDRMADRLGNHRRKS